MNPVSVSPFTSLSSALDSDFMNGFLLCGLPTFHIPLFIILLNNLASPLHVESPLFSHVKSVG